MNLLSFEDIFETINMIKEENLDIRTITMGISLYDCAADDVDTVCERIYTKVTTRARDLVKVGNDIEKEYGIPIINKRVSVTPISLVGGRYTSEDTGSVGSALSIPK